MGSVGSAVPIGNVLVVDLTDNIRPGDLADLQPRVAEVAVLLAGRVAIALDGAFATLG